MLTITEQELQEIIDRSIRLAVVPIVNSTLRSLGIPTVKDFFWISQAADLVKKSIPTLYDLVHKREIPFYKRGGRLYFSKLELIAWIKEGKIPTNEEIRAMAAASKVSERRSRTR